ncbi:MAG: AAA family ATPase [Pseudomonadota bacterium]
MSAMYLQHFGLKEAPFALTPNAEYFLNVQGYQEGLNVLQVGLENCDSFMKVTGEVGTGKTLLCRKLIAGLGEKYHLVYLRSPCSTDIDLFCAVALALHIPDALQMPRATLLTAIDAKLSNIHQQGKRCILLVDEAQAMSLKALEALRFLSSAEGESEQIQIILFGQPELNVKLASPKLRQLRQRIVFSYHLNPMDRHSVGLYIHHRLFVAGYQGDVLFSPKSLDLMYQATRGVPRLVNIIGHKALMVAFGRGSSKVVEAHVKRAIDDTEQVHRSFGYTLKPEVVQLGVAILAVCTLGVYLYQQLSF